MSTSKNEQLSTLSNTGLEGNVKNFSKKDFCNYIVGLRNKLEELESYRFISKRVEFLERNVINQMQYNRRESIEISGLDKIQNSDLERTTVGILADIGVGKIESWQVQVCHRLKNPKNMVIKFVCRKHAALALHNRKKLRNLDTNKHGLDWMQKFSSTKTYADPLNSSTTKFARLTKTKISLTLIYGRETCQSSWMKIVRLLISSILMISLILV